MYDDLEPPFVPSTDTALIHVTARVRRLRLRRRFRQIVLGAGAVVIVVMLASSVFGSNGGTPHRVTVANNSTTTTDVKPFVLPPTTGSSTTSTSTTVSTTTTTTVPVTTTTTLRPAHLTVTLDRQRLVIPSGASANVSYTVKNSGDRPGHISVKVCPNNQLWPDTISRTAPELWPVPASPTVFCNGHVQKTIRAHGAKTFDEKLFAGQHDDHGNLVPAPAGKTTFVIAGVTLPVTITPSGAAPLTVDHPAEVTTPSGAQRWVDFTITNHLSFPVRFTDWGPCSKEAGSPCDPTTPNGAIPRDLRAGPYKSAEQPLYRTSFSLAAHETKPARAEVNGTINLGDPTQGFAAMPPGVYHFDWDGQKVKFTVTAAAP